MKNSLNSVCALMAALLVGLAGCASAPVQENAGNYDVATTTKVMAQRVADKEMCSQY